MGIFDIDVCGQQIEKKISHDLNLIKKQLKIK